MNEWATTRRAPGEVHFTSGEVLQGDMHLQYRQGIPGNTETPLEMLNRDEAFFALTLGDDAVRLVAKSQVVTVALGNTRYDEGPAPAQHQTFSVHLANGRDFEGDVHIVLPPPATRGIDFLNQPEPFFALHAADGLWCLNRHHVCHVRPHD